MAIPELHFHFHEGDPQLEARVTQLEETVATAAEQLTVLQTQVTEWVEDINAKLDQLEQAQGNLNPEAQAVFDSLKATVEAGVAAVGDADADGNPATPPPPEPTPTP